MSEAETSPGSSAPARDPAALAELRRAAMEAAQRFGVSAQEFERVERELAVQSGGAAGPGDVFWALSTRAIERYSKARDWDGAGIVYYAQARWLHQHEPGHDFRDLLRLAHEAAVLDLQKRRHHRRVAIEARRCCSSCAERDGEEFSFARALQESPLPNPACELEWCACTWRGIPIERR